MPILFDKYVDNATAPKIPGITPTTPAIPICVDEKPQKYVLKYIFNAAEKPAAIPEKIPPIKRTTKEVFNNVCRNSFLISSKFSFLTGSSKSGIILCKPAEDKSIEPNINQAPTTPYI